MNTVQVNQLIKIIIPKEQHEGTRSEVGRWLKKVGDFVNKNEPILEINTDKVTLEIAAPESGILAEIRHAAGTSLDLNATLGFIRTAANDSKTNSSDNCNVNQSNYQAKSSLSAHSQDNSSNLSPAVKKLLAEHNLSADQISGTGKGGRITAEDVLKAASSTNCTAQSSKPNNRVNAINSTRIPHTAMRKSIADHMVSSLLHTAPHVTSVFQADLSAILKHKRANEAEFQSRGARLTLSSYFIKATSDALKVVPEVNSRWHQDALELFSDHNISIATALADKGLVVPVLKQVQNLDLFEIAQSLAEITERARSGKLVKNDFEEGTFTISNHGVSGSLFAAPIIINQPQSAILGIGKVEKRVVVTERQGQEHFESIPCCYVTLTIDHRVLDGFSANTFLSAFVKTLETFRGQ